MDRPAVLLLTDDPHIARAIGMLLHDWGYDGWAADSGWDKAGSGRRVVGILVDLLVARTTKALDAALALRNRVGAPVPILIQANDGCASVPYPSAAQIAILPKPVDPSHIRAWLASHGRP
jgi:CheY-like chemotaxis protein